MTGRASPESSWFNALVEVRTSRHFFVSLLHPAASSAARRITQTQAMALPLLAATSFLNRKIPFCKMGSQYLFKDSHLLFRQLPILFEKSLPSRRIGSGTGTS